MISTGQACTASKRIIVIGKERGEQFLQGLKQAMSGFKVGDPADKSTTLGPLFAERGLTKLLDQIKRAKASGGKSCYWRGAH
jgi:succinate-semialdehyde dehydrogenase/glutarate-semialdehyde dehydrogenase